MLSNRSGSSPSASRRAMGRAARLLMMGVVMGCTPRASILGGGPSAADVASPDEPTARGKTVSAPTSARERGAASFEYVERTAAIGWSGPRDGAGLVQLGGSLFLIGGWTPSAIDVWGADPTTNEVLQSTDGGRTWTTILAHDPDPPKDGPGARFRRVHTAGVLTHTFGGTRYIYLVGGDHLDPDFSFPTYSGEVWRSADGVAWTRVSDQAPCRDRMLHMVASFQGALYLMGGQHELDDGATAMNDVWKSLDGGVTWIRLPDAPWSRRAMVYSPAEHRGELYVIGGGTYAGTDSERAYFNDVWKMTADERWVQVLPNGHDQFEPRQYHNVVSYDGKLWVIGGYNGIKQDLDSVYWSDDGGSNWHAIAAAAWGRSHADGIVVTSEGIMHAGGSCSSDGVTLLRRRSSTVPVQSSPTARDHARIVGDRNVAH